MPRPPDEHTRFHGWYVKAGVLIGHEIDKTLRDLAQARGGTNFMNNRFLRIGNVVISINHIVDVYRHAGGDIDVFLSSRSLTLRLEAEKGEAEAFWNWITSAMNATTLQVQTQQEICEPTTVS